MITEEKVLTVPMEVRYAPSWLSWVGSTTACLQALGVDCDVVDVAGTTGYAFHIGIANGLCPSGPTVLEWSRLLEGVSLLGRSTLVFQNGQRSSTEAGDPQEKAQYWWAFQVARREVEEGRPCVVWGAYVPEFAAVLGITGESYLVTGCMGCNGQEEPPIPYDGLDAPGGVYVLGFPTATAPGRAQADRLALANAVRVFHGTLDATRYTNGSAAYDLWLQELEGRRAVGFGNSYNAACYSDGRRFAGDFLARVAERNESLAEPLKEAVASYRQAAGAMERVTVLFPFPGSQEPITDADVIGRAVEALKEARDAETHAIDLVTSIVAGFQTL